MPASSTTDTPLIAGRYRVESSLAVGGMGEVLLVFDTSTNTRVALKRMLDADNARVSSMFEREYHALVQLKHPRIIEVYDYGVDHGKPYYTMELLDGQDLRQLAPLPYRQACRYLRDVASSLALLHARRLLHRDVSPRNVRVTSDDRCKLIDFGGLASFGMMDVVVGTPPYLAPEAVQRIPLDHRADLFALGAVAYWLLTAKHAFPARTIQELPDLWRRGARSPRAVVEERAGGETIPKALDELVMSLLTPDPLGRPESAVEVIDRLNTLAELEPEHNVLSVRSYLHGAQTVGRSRERSRLRRRLDRSLKGEGASVVLDAVPGMGSTRLLAELALDAQLAGATSVMVDAQLSRGVYGVAHALIEKLLVTLPEESVRAAAVDPTILARFSPLLGARIAHASELGPLPPGELRRRTQNALSEWLFAIARERPLLLAIDNAQAADEGSAALLASLARAARGHALLLIVARKPGEDASSAAALRTLEEAGTTIKLRALDRDDVQGLVRGIFGEVPNIARLAEWIHSLSGGNPGACMDLARHLVDTNVIRFNDGVWALPQELSPGELPESLEQTLDARIDRLEPNALALARALCVHRGSLPIERCLAIAHIEGIAEPVHELEALSAEDVLTQSGASYHFGHEAVRERMYAKLSDQRRQALHRHFGRLLADEQSKSTDAQADLNAMLDAGWHLLEGGEQSEGADRLAEVGRLLTHGADELAASVPALRAALTVFRAEKRAKHEILPVLASLAIAGFRVDRRLAIEYGDEALELFADLLGLKLAARLRPVLGARLSLYLGLGSAAVRSVWAHGPSGIAALRYNVSTFFTCAVSLAAAATICFDIPRIKRSVGALEPLAALGDDHPAAISYRFAKTLARLPEDAMADVAAGCQETIARVEDTTRPVKGLPEDSRLLLLGGAWYALGAMSCFRDGPLALQCAEKLDALGLKLYAMAADQVRTMYHALRGDLASSRRYRERVEMHAVQAGSGWQVEIWGPCGTTLVHTLTRDVIGIKHVIEELDRLVKEVPTLARHLQLARGVYLELKGELVQSHEIRRAVLEGAPARAFIGWPPTVGSEAATLIALGRAAEAKALAQTALDGMRPADEPYIAMYQKVHIGAAMADAALGDFPRAIERIEALLERHTPDEGPMTLGNLHATRVRIAWMMADVDNAQLHLAQMERWFRPTANPALIGQCERLRRDVTRLIEDKNPTALTEATFTSHVQSEADTARSLLSECVDASERYARALELVVSRTRGSSGHLFLYNPTSMQLERVAPQPSEPPPSELAHALLDALHDAQYEENEATSAISTSELAQITAPERDRDRIQIGDASYRIVLLITTHGGKLRLVGAVAVLETSSTTVAVRPQILDAICRALLETEVSEKI